MVCGLEIIIKNSIFVFLKKFDNKKRVLYLKSNKRKNLEKKKKKNEKNSFFFNFKGLKAHQIF
jgi:hypothetical protein